MQHRHALKKLPLFRSQISLQIAASTPHACTQFYAFTLGTVSPPTVLHPLCSTQLSSIQNHVLPTMHALPRHSLTLATSSTLTFPLTDSARALARAMEAPRSLALVLRACRVGLRGIHDQVIIGYHIHTKPLTTCAERLPSSYPTGSDAPLVHPTPW